MLYQIFRRSRIRLSDEDEVIFISREETIIDVRNWFTNTLTFVCPCSKLGCEKPGEEPQCNKEVLKYIARQQKEASEKIEDRS